MKTKTLVALALVLIFCLFFNLFGKPVTGQMMTFTLALDSELLFFDSTNTYQKIIRLTASPEPPDDPPFVQRWLIKRWIVKDAQAPIDQDAPTSVDDILWQSKAPFEAEVEAVIGPTPNEPLLTCYYQMVPIFITGESGPPTNIVTVDDADTDCLVLDKRAFLPLVNRTR